MADRRTIAPITPRAKEAPEPFNMTATVTLLVVVGIFLVVSLFRVESARADCSDVCPCDDGRVTFGMTWKLVPVVRVDVTYEGESWFIPSVCAGWVVKVWLGVQFSFSEYLLIHVTWTLYVDNEFILSSKQ